MPFRTTLIAFGAGLLLMLPTLSAQPTDPKTDHSTANLTSADRNFLLRTYEGGKMEVELGQMAAQKSSNSDVKNFGQRMADDHTKGGQEIEDLAKQKGLTLPSGKAHPKDTLSKLSGDAFDKAYMKQMVDDHEKVVADLEKESASAHDPDVKALASKLLPTIREHLDQARTVASKVGSGKSKSN